MDSSDLETTLGVALIGSFIWLMHLSRFGLTSGREILVTLTVPRTGSGDTPAYAPAFETHLRGHDLINVRSVRGGERLELTFYVQPRRDTDLVAFSTAMSALPAVADVSLVVSQDDEIPDNVF